MAKRPTRRKPVRKVPSPTSLRKLRPAELEKLGLSRKSERYVRKGLKHPSKRSPTYSKRQYLKGQRGDGTNETYRAARAVKTKILPTGHRRLIYKMPVKEGPFTKRLKEIQSQYKSYDRARGVFILEGDDRSSSTSRFFLKEASWEHIVNEEGKPSGGSSGESGGQFTATKIILAFEL